MASLRGSLGTDILVVQVALLQGSEIQQGASNTDSRQTSGCPHSILLTMTQAVAYKHNLCSCRAWPPWVGRLDLARNYTPGRPPHPA